MAIITQEEAGWELPGWQRQQADLITDPAELLSLLQLEAESLPEMLAAAQDFPLRVPRGYVRLMEPGNPDDPLLRQVLSVPAELREEEGYSSDPLEEASHTPVPGLLHKYHGRALLVVTGACAVHCRYCFRRHFPYQSHLSGKRWDQALEWLASRSDIREVILSGGDPLTLNNRRLQELLAALAKIPHLRRLRIHSRTPVVIPGRLDGPLLALLSDARWQTALVLHANHSREISDELVNRCRQWRRQGITLLNQSVLLAGVNDSVDALEALSDRLHEAGVMPYYLHQLDAVQGAAHFAVSDSAAMQLHKELRSRLPGFLVPRLSREEPGEPAKTVLAG
ncbi:EF-P beta-lysylation protein EpmB [uncultured Alcanivorax sp.]|uniref:EF-P beta-lysylation protein EpmB n=1 Tax=uncultured Alcanivorax sp. TaxID=191215 RepID=UPI00344C1521